MYKLNRTQQILTQIILGVIGLFVLIPIWALLTIALDGAFTGQRPLHFHPYPAEWSLETFTSVLTNPAQGMSFFELFRNSMVVSLGSALIGVGLGMSAAYAFARYRFPGRQVGLFALLLGTLLPPTALMVPLFMLLTRLDMRSSLFGLMIAYTAFAMPFCLWNMRAAFQAIPLELEESAFLDGASAVTTFLRITLPLALPSVAIAGLIAFLASYTEFALGWMFVERNDTVTLAMAIGNLPGWNTAAALGLLMSIPVVIVTLLLRRYFIRGALLGTVE